MALPKNIFLLISIIEYEPYLQRVITNPKLLRKYVNRLRQSYGFIKMNCDGWENTDKSNIQNPISIELWTNWSKKEDSYEIVFKDTCNYTPNIFVDNIDNYLSSKRKK